MTLSDQRQKNEQDVAQCKEHHQSGSIEEGHAFTVHTDAGVWLPDLTLFSLVALMATEIEADVH